ncbi:MAG: amidohydrolase, partial [Acidobacteria bacterium Pan2503]|nr:amidohydrolase [Candidatus Acidoferrum panamensis]
MKRNLTAVINFLALLAPLPLPHEGINQAPIAFTHVVVIDTANASIQQDMTVFIVGDHIADVGKAAEIKVPKSVQVVDARGKFLIPGLWDMHVHTFRHSPRSTNTWYFPLFIANGVTGVRDMWTTGDDFPQVVQFRKDLADGSFLGPRYGAVAWTVDGPEPIFPNSDVVTTPQEARDFVHRVKASGVD